MGGTFLKEEIYEHTRRCPLCQCDDELTEQIYSYAGEAEKVKSCPNCHTTFKLMKAGGKK